MFIESGIKSMLITLMIVPWFSDFKVFAAHSSHGMRRFLYQAAISSFFSSAFA
jgi:hypothetical protein